MAKMKLILVPAAYLTLTSHAAPAVSNLNQKHVDSLPVLTQKLSNNVTSSQNKTLSSIPTNATSSSSLKKSAANATKVTNVNETKLAASAVPVKKDYDPDEEDLLEAKHEQE